MNITTAGLNGAPGRLGILTMAAYKPNMPFASLWGMGHHDTSHITFAHEALIEQTIRYKGLWE